MTETDASGHLAVQVERSGGRTSVVSLTGELDLSTIPAMEPRLSEELRSSRSLIMDLRGVTFIDSSGIGMLIHAFRETDGDARLHTVIAPGSQVERVFRLAGIDRALPTFVSLDEAITALVANRDEVA